MKKKKKVVVPQTIQDALYCTPRIFMRIHDGSIKDFRGFPIIAERNLPEDTALLVLNGKIVKRFKFEWDKK